MREEAARLEGLRRPNRSVVLLAAGNQHMLEYMLTGREEFPMAELERHVRLFRNGRNQALRIPREFEFEGSEAILRKEGDRLIVEPVRKGRLLALLGALGPLNEPFPDVDEGLAPLDDVTL